MDKKLIADSQRIVIISGAGISVNAGIPDFQSQKKHGSLAGTVSQSQAEALSFYQSMRQIRQRSVSTTAKPTTFHVFMDRIAREGRLLRHYTQNVDCLEQQFPALENRTVRLHGQVDQGRCTRCDWVGRVSSRIFHQQLPCRGTCLKRKLSRVNQGRRPIGLGSLRPDILLYGEDNPNEEAILQYAKEDLRRSPDLILVVGTQLKVPGARALAKSFCRTVANSGGKSIWLNKKQGTNLTGFHIVLKADCDEFAIMQF